MPVAPHFNADLVLSSTRADRGMGSMRMFLIDHAAPRFKVKGDTASVYTVHMDPAKPDEAACTCPDFAKRNLACKHLLWLATRLFLLSYHDGMTWRQLCSSTRASVTTPAAPLAPAAARQLVEVQTILSGIMAQHGARWTAPRLDAASTCSICLEPIVPLPADDKVHWCRYQCGNVIHASCGLHMTASTCPTCRNPKFYTNRTYYGH
jgi:hypothetical protein